MSEFNKTELLEKTTEYMNYIAQHKENIRKAWLELRDALKGIDLFQRPKILDEMEWRIRNHDDSKMSEEEFLPYRQHFYPVAGEVVDDAAFELASSAIIVLTIIIGSIGLIVMETLCPITMLTRKSVLIWK